LRRQLDDLSRRYTDEHPDVLAVKRNIASLETQKRQEIEARNRQGGGKLKVAPTSPVFQKIRVELADAEAKVASLRGQLSAQQSQLDQARTMAGRMPEVEAELAQLNRDYDVVRKNYEQLVTRRESASLGEEIDRTTKVAEFRVVEPPRVSPTPSKPSRQLVAMLTAVAAIGAGLGVTFVLSQLFPTVNDTAKLKEVSGRPVLGSISLVISGDRQVHVRRDMQLFGATFALLLIANAAWFMVVKHQLLP
jgi:polysaccharide chain length determinant protein (PEP-CTERM system associated)